MVTRRASSDKEITQALAAAKPGDTVSVEAGTYHKPIVITTDGITLDAKPGAVLDLNGANKPGILILGDHVTVRGFEVRESAKSGVVAQGVHNTTIEDVYSHHNAGNGIFGGKVDFFTVRDSEVSFNNGDAGISWHPKDHGLGGSGYHVEITGNHAHHNEQVHAGRHLEGMGIMADNNPELDFDFSTLIARNKVHHNGHDGILAFNIERLFLRFNDIWHNGQDETVNKARLAEFEARDSDVHAVGNRIQAEAGHKTVVLQGFEGDHDFVWKRNVISVDDSPKHHGLAAFQAHEPRDLPTPSENYLGVELNLDAAPGVHANEIIWW